MDYRNRLTPIALSRKYPLSEVVVDFLSCHSHINKLFCDCFLSLFYSKSAKFFRIHKLAALAKIILFFKGMLTYITTIYYLYPWYVMCLRILKISLIVAWNRHNSSCTVACKYEVTYVYRDFLTIYRIYSIYSLKHTARLCFIKLSSVHIVLFEGFIYVFLYCFFIFNPWHKALNCLTIRGKHHKGDTVNSLYTGCIDGEFPTTDYLEINLYALAFSYPVSLHFFG